MTPEIFKMLLESGRTFEVREDGSFIVQGNESKRSDRNKRYYQSKKENDAEIKTEASKNVLKRLKTSESTESPLPSPSLSPSPPFPPPSPSPRPSSSFSPYIPLFPLSQPLPSLAENVPKAEKLKQKVEERKNETDPIKLRLFALFNRRTSRLLDNKESKAFRDAKITEDDLSLVEEYYNDNHPEWEGKDYRRRDLGTLLNNWNQDVDKAESWKAFAPAFQPKKKPIFTASI